MENIKLKFDFDDILIVPNINTKITSRYNDIILPSVLPLFTAPMDTVVDLNNMITFLSNGINVALPRTISYETYFTNYYKAYYNTINLHDDIFVSLGFNDLENFRKMNYSAFHQNLHLIIDTANGHMQKIVDYCKEIKKLRPDIIIMIGNIANPETYYWYWQQGCIDYIRVGIGNGSGCITTKQSGIGYPMASLIYEIKQIKNKIEKLGGNQAPFIVADGGMKDYSDIIKSLALGADFVMVGSLFNKAFESSANNYLYGIKLNKKIAEYLFNKGYPIKKYFRGMSTKEAQKAMGKTHFRTSEGVTRFRRVEYHLNGWIENFEHYLRNAMSYANAETLHEFIGKIDICQISKNAYDRFNK